MGVRLRYVQNDTAPIFQFSLARPDGTVPTLSGSTVAFIIKSPSGTVTNTGHQTCTITSTSLGQGYYPFATGDLPDAGTYTCDLQITYSGGTIETPPKPVQIIARAEAG